ncbi:hypothetical protein NDU88_001626 [Pleurodeles waltl]|uniref:Uncharacterized protein n=1 Tax=Pleurodeles waltl TaxID=8319 RepID=A0AAV7MM92_PLEWA|nr:hypothetical protein NDU88_001626 [Pleurodeles waltl]
MVRDTGPHYEGTSALREQVADSQQKRGIHNDHLLNKRRARTPDIQVGDLVLFQNRQPGGKFRLPFEPSPWMVSRVQGTMFTANQGDESVTRNVLFFKRYLGTGASLDAEAQDVRGCCGES